MNDNIALDAGSLMNPSIAEKLRIFSRIASVVVIVTAVLVLAGWVFHIEELKRINRSFVAMNPLTAICFIMAGSSLWLLKEPVLKHLLAARILAGFVAFVGLTKLLSVLLAFEYRLDRLLFTKYLIEAEKGIQNVMAPNTAFCFLLAGLALLLIDYEFGKKRRPSQFMCIVITLLSLLSLYGYIYGVKYLIGFAAFIPMAANTAMLFLLLAIGILFARPNKGSMAIVFGSEETGEALFTRLFAIIFPLILGWLKLRGENFGYFNKEFGTALFAISTYAFTMFLLGRNALMKYRVRKQRLRTFYLLQEDAKKLQSILDNTLSPIYIKNMNGTYEQVNRQFAQVANLAANEIKGKTEFDIFPPEVAEQINQTDQEVIETATTKYLEEVFTLENEERTYLTVKFPLKDTEGEIYGICSTSTDITERKQMETMLRNSEERLNAILSGMGEGVVVVDNSGRYIYYNEIAENILGIGITDTPLEERPVRYGFFKTDGITVYPAEELPLVKGLKGEPTNNVEILVRNENIPEGRSVKLTGRPIYNDKNEIIASVVVCRDITHEKELEHLIHENEEKLHAVIATVGEGVVVADRRGRFVLFNSKAEEILGVSLEDMTAAGWAERYRVYHPDGELLYPAEELPLARALKGETTSGVELCIKSPQFPDGKLITVSGRPVLDDDGKVAAGVVDFRDVSDVRHLEHALEEIKQKYRELIRQGNQMKTR